MNFPGHSESGLPVQLSSVAHSCLTLCDPMGCSTPGFPVHHQLPELAQSHVHQISDANHLILCRPLLLPPSIFPSIRVFQIQGWTQLPRSELLSSLGAQSSEFKPISQGEVSCPWVAKNLLNLNSVSLYFCLLPNGRFQIYHKSNNMDRISTAGKSLNKLWSFVSR